MLNIRDIISAISAITLKNLLFIHAKSSCDTTSATFGQGKGKMLSSEELQELSQLFYEDEASHVEILQAGLRIFVIMYGGKSDDNLNKLCYAHYMNLVASPEYHNYHVHLQLVQWKTLYNISGAIYKINNDMK